MAKNVVVEGCQFSLPVSTTGRVSITSQPENSLVINNKKIYAGTMSISVSNFTSLVVTNGDGSGSGTINGTSIEEGNGKKLLLEGDSCSITISGTANYGTSDPKHPVTEVIEVKISDAGQGVVVAE